ncbi:MAG TPA: hypothetical protein VFS21_38900 [Roseiflexaceae bacterium]|nr:hypothetical protein [Roseiflexaceae bacterium]
MRRQRPRWRTLLLISLVSLLLLWRVLFPPQQQGADLGRAVRVLVMGR